jgi:putative transposase
MKRTNTVQLIVDKAIEDKLKELAIATAKCWNEVNWLRMQDYKNHRRRDFNETEKEVYHKYKKILKVNASQACIKNAEAWLSFFELTKEKKEGKLPKWFKPKPPKYWKYNKEGDYRYRYRLIVLIRNDRYILDEEKQEIYLKDFKLTLRFKGKLKWRGKQGRLEIQYNKARRRWYAYIPMEIQKEGDENKEKQKKKNEEGLKASVDLGIVNLATVYVEDGSCYLFKGGSVLSEYEHYSKKIAVKQKILARHEQRRSRSLSMLYDKRRRFLKHTLNSMVRRIMVLLKEKGVTDVIIGYPKDISKNRGNKLTANFWNYGYIIDRFKDIGEELGIKVITVNEGNTSKTCCLCKEVHDNGRVKRGLFKCPCIGNVINADLNGAVNILHMHTHSPESLGTMDNNNKKSITNNRSTVMDRGLSMVRDRGKWLKTQPVVYRWMSRAGWVGDDELSSNHHHLPTSNEVMKMKAVNHKPMITLKGTLTL